VKPTADLLFVQRRPTRAGAQTSLWRIVKSSPSLPLILSAAHGWLDEALPGTIVSTWPSPRSWPARLGGLTRFAKSIAPRLQGIRAVVANDHQECPLALALAKRLDLPCLAILRTPGMSQRDFSKYQCDQCNHLFAVGDELLEKVTRWATAPSSLFVEGFLKDEFLPVPAASPQFPSRILVAGSEEPRKGFRDFLTALEILRQEHPKFALEEVVFTGHAPAEAVPRLDCHLEFAGRIADFIPFARQFDFAIHPSRHETFGLAPLELIISGIPTLATATGCLDESLLPVSWLVPPASPPDLAQALLDWQKNWPDRRAHLAGTIDTIRERYDIQKTLAPFFATVDRLTSRSLATSTRKT
jgi:glycosyltransferase involved in cell wall biosynthesis